MAHILKIENRKIIQIPIMFFDLYWCENIEILYLNLNNLQILHSTDLQKFLNVKNLTLIAVNLEVIEDGSFDKLLKIEVLHLETTSLLVIDNKVFSNQLSLENLTLIVPNLTQFPRSLLKHLKNITYLKMDHSCALKENFFKSLTSIEILDWRSAIELGYLHHENLILPTLKCLKLNNRDFQFNDFMQLPKLIELHVVRSLFLYRCINTIFSPNLKVVNLSNNVNITFINFTRFNENHALVYLNMSNNCITNIKSGSFKHFSQLNILNLSHNIINVTFNLFNGLGNLTVLNLAHNEFRDVDFNDISYYLNHLRVLNLGYNYVEFFFQSFKTYFANLSHVYLCDNNIKSLCSIAIRCSTNRNLVLLDFQYNVVEWIASEFFWHMKYLTYLYLNQNIISSLNSVHFERLDCLQYLDLSHNLIQFLDYDLFEKLYQLRHLNLSFNHIKLVAVGLFRNMFRLQFLDLSSNVIDEIPSEIFKFNRKLSHLYLNSNYLTYLSDRIFSYSSLVLVDVSRNKFKRFSRFILFGNSNLECCYVIDSEIKKCLSFDPYFDKFKFVVIDLTADKV